MSTSMWAASARSERLPVASATTISTVRKQEVSAKTTQRRLVWRELGVWPGCTEASQRLSGSTSRASPCRMPWLS